jgi:hypothetical protein
MTDDRREPGTPIVELDEDEFVRRYEAGDLDEGDPDVSDLASLLWSGQTVIESPGRVAQASPIT